MIQDTEDATSLYNYTNVEMTKDAGATTYSAPEGTTLLWKDGNHEAVAFNAYTTDGTTFTVQSNQSTAANVLASDLLGAVKTDDDETSDIDICNPPKKYMVHLAQILTIDESITSLQIRYIFWSFFFILFLLNCCNCFK
jgi:hypothetical protein